MKTGLNSEHRRNIELREQLDLPSNATDMAVVEALLNRCMALEGRLKLLELSLKLPLEPPEEWTTDEKY